MSKPLLATTLKNAFLKAGPYETYLKNISINGVKTGCSGFVKNTITGKIAYLCTEHSVYGPVSDKSYYRTAENMDSYLSGHGFNNFCKDDELVENVIVLIS